MAPMRFDPRCHLFKGSRRSLLSKAIVLFLQARRRSSVLRDNVDAARRAEVATAGGRDRLLMDMCRRSRPILEPSR